MDSWLESLVGPNPVQATGTVTIPRELLRAVGVEPGRDRVHWALNQDIPGTLIMIPAVLVARAMPDVTKALKRLSK